MRRLNCQQCQRVYSDGLLLVTDWPYWKGEDDDLICPECCGIDVAAELEKHLTSAQGKDQ